MVLADFEAQGKAAIDAAYQGGFSDGVASVPVQSGLSAAQVIADLQSLASSEASEIQALITKYSPAPAPAAAS